MKKVELLQKLNNIAAEGLNSSIPVSELIPLLQDLEVEKAVSSDVMNKIVREVGERIENEGINLFLDYTLELRSREVEIYSVEFDVDAIETIIRDAFSDFLEVEED